MTKTTSVRLTKEEQDNLNAIARSVGCKSWRVMLVRIANSEIYVDEAHKSTMTGLGGFVPVLDSHPIKLETTPPAWDAPMCQKSEFVTDRGDGTFVDTEEFDKPVPQKRVPGAVEAFAGIFGMKAEVLPESGNVHVPSVSSNVEAMKNATKEQKIQAALAAMGSAIKKGSEL